ncbi:hypothetical protein DRE_00095 [Drechslerella stenobrocha 248]|uniref:Extracellular membrane protein CFEM domain-containing protein n=1 Tax=Drechslerella stenobrocha 248 TaxID=1043628 RepID=W7IHQ1_9PEZI|nr:hypothetical protein DRE_00095 [Drechslerella stenobrocha 248]
MTPTFLLIVLLAWTLQIAATPVPKGYSTAASKHHSKHTGNNFSALAAVARPFDEYDCIDRCFHEIYNPCKGNERCRTTCSSFVTAFSGQLDACIRRDCQPKTTLGHSYVRSAKDLAGLYCDIATEVALAFGVH